MSDSELSDAPASKVHPDRALEKALCKETRKQFDDPLKTVNSIRMGAEEALDLETGFFANSEEWRARSKKIIKDEIDILENAPESSSRTVSANPSPAKPKTTKPAAKAAPKKRPSPDIKKPPKKRQRKSVNEDSDNESLTPLEDSNVESEPKGKMSKSKAKGNDHVPAKVPKISKADQKAKFKLKRQESDSQLSNAEASDPVGKQAPGKSDDDNSGSELSVLQDEEPRSKKKRLSKDPEKPKKVAKAKPVADDDPDQEHIKKLQGWLVKCGIRKIWAFELKPYETPKAKIKHLQEMLSDVGMTGRFSLEKASQIKEARELAADIEAVQEGNEIWGKDGEERSRRSKRPDYAGAEGDETIEDSASKRKLVRGPKRYDFLSSDGEESD